jgi:hypothetical protein
LVPASQQPRNIKGASTEGGTRSKTHLKLQIYLPPNLTFLGIIFFNATFFDNDFVLIATFETDFDTFF